MKKKIAVTQKKFKNCAWKHGSLVCNKKKRIQKLFPKNIVFKCQNERNSTCAQCLNSIFGNYIVKMLQLETSPTFLEKLPNKVMIHEKSLSDQSVLADNFIQRNSVLTKRFYDSGIHTITLDKTVSSIKEL